MKFLYFAAALFVCVLLGHGAEAQRFWVASGAGPNFWNDTNNWSTSSGGAGGASVPGASDVVTFNALRNGNCTLDVAPTIAGITISGYTGTIDINGFDLTTTGTNTFTTGFIVNGGGSAALTLNTTTSTTFNGTTLSANVNGSTGRIFFNGSTFNGTVNVTKTDNNNDNSTGNNIFNGVTTITNLGGGQVLLGNGSRDQFNAVTTFNNNGSYRFYFAFSHSGQTTTFATDLILNTSKVGGADAWSFLIAEGVNTSVSFGGSLTINCAGTLQSNHRILQGTGTQATYNGSLNINVTNTNAATVIQMGTVGTSTYNGNILVSNSGGSSGISFNTSATATSTLAATRSISIGAGGFTSGTLNLLRFAQTGATNQNLNSFSGNSTLTVGPSSQFDGDVSFIAPRINLNGCVYGGSAFFEKNGAGADNSAGGNTVQGITTIVNSGSGEFNLGNTNPDIFNNNVIVNNTGTSRIQIGVTAAGNIINGNLTINHGGNSPGSINTILTRNSSATTTVNGDLFLTNTNADANSGIIISNDGTTTINGNISVSSTSGRGVYFGNGTGSVIQNTGSTISNGAFSTGTLYFSRYTQNGTIPITLLLTGTSAITTINGSSFGGNVDFKAPQIILNGGIFNGAAMIEKTGAVDNAGTGGNIFNGVTTITNSGSGYLMTGNGNRDQFNAAATFNNNGSYRIYFAHNHPGQTTTFASDLTLNSNKSGGADQWSYLIAENGTSAISVGGNLAINCAGTLRSDHRLLNGTGSSISIAGTTNVAVTNSHVSTLITLGENGTSTYNGNITVSNTGGAAGITFNTNAAASSTVNGTIAIGGGYTSGALNLYRFNQVGAIAHNLTLTTGAILRVGPSSEFDGDVTFTSPQVYLNGCTYQGTVTIEKNGAVDNAGTGGNIFNGVAIITNSGSGYLMTGNGNRDQFNAAATFNNNGSYRIYFAHNHPGQTTTFASDLTLNSNKSGGADQWSYLIAENGTSAISVGGNLAINCAGTIRSDHRLLNGTGSSATYGGQVTINVTNTSTATVIIMGENGTSTYNGNISVANSGGAGGITFNNQAISSSTLNGSISSGVFSSGSLNLYRFNQVGAFAQSLTLTNNGTILRVGPNSEFDGNVTFIAPRLLLNGAIYQGVTSLEKNGNTNDDGNGGNTFNGTTTIVDSGSGHLLTANTSPDIFNGALTATNSGSNWIYLAHNVAGNQFNNDITVNNTGSALGIVFSNNSTGASTFTGGTITVGGGGYTVGDLRLRRFTQIGAINQNVTLTGSARLWIGPNSAFDGNVTFIAPQLLLNGATYNGTAYLEKNGATANDGTGGNIFNQTTTIVNSGSNYLLTASTSPDVFNANLILTNSGSSTIRMADNAAGNQFNGNIEINSTFGGGIYFGNNAAGTSTLAATGTIGVGASGVLSGDIRLIRFTQVGPTAQTLDLTGIAILTLGPSSTFGGDIDFKAPQLLLNGTTFNGPNFTTLEKKGATDNAGNGGNVFNSLATTLTNSGSGYLLTANTSPDLFNDDLTVTNTGSSIIYLAHNVAGNQFNGNVTFNSTLGSGGVYFSNAATGAATLGNGASLLTGVSGFSSGELRFRRFTQIGAAAQTLVLTGTALLRIGPASTFNGNVDFRAPQFALDGAIYNGTTYLEKTGATNNDSAGGNTFNGATTIANSGTGFFRFALTTLDTFNGQLTLTNTGSSTIRMADNIPGTIFNGNIIVNSTFGGGIYFSESGGGTASLAAGRTISVGASGFSIGELRLRRFTQIGGTPQSLVFTGTAGLVLGPTLTFNGDVDFRSPQLFINAATYNGTAYLEKTGATDNSGTNSSVFALAATIRNSGSGYLRTDGNHTFNGPTSLINSGSNYLLLELTTGSTYNGDLTLTNSGTSNVRMAYLGNSTFNGNIQVNSTSGNGIIFCEQGTATATLANGRTISVGGSGFTNGTLRLQRFTQVGGTAQNIVLTNSATFQSGPSTVWNGNLTVSSPILLLDGNTTNGTTNSLTKTGASTDNSAGGNTFGGTTTFNNSGTGVFRLATTTTDDFTGDVTFNQSSGTIQPAYNIASTFRGNVTVNGSTAITFGANNGTITFAGGNSQTVIRSGTASPVFRRLLMNKSSNSVTLNTDVSITVNATFTAGILNTSSVNFINFVDNATVTGGSNASHVDGPVRKTGNDPFSFPTGDGGFYRAISISAPSNVAHYFTAEYFKASQSFGGAATYPAGIVTVSSCEYWTLDRNPLIGGSNVNVTLSWNSPDCVGPYITDLTDLRVMRWNGTAWVNEGNTLTTGNATMGTITSALISSFSPITLGSTTLDNALPIQLLSFTAEEFNSQVKLSWTTASELNNDFFTVQRSENGEEFKSIATIKGAGTANTKTNYEFIDSDPIESLLYYRLKQTDFDKTSSYSSVVAIDMSKESLLSLYPNPANAGRVVTISKKGSYLVMNNLGVVVLRLSQTDLIDSAVLSPGVYTVRSAAGEVKRLVVQ